MSNLMITHYGALGDHGFTVPVITELRKTFRNIYLYGYPRSELALGATRLIDKYINVPYNLRDQLKEEYGDDAERQYGYWCYAQVDPLKIDASTDFKGVLAGKYVFHENLDPRAADWSQQRKIENAKGINFFDIFTERAAEDLDMPELVEKVKGTRPTTRHTLKEKAWLNGFRRAYGIKDGSFLLGWQFTGSSRHKDYPHVGDVMLELKKWFREIHVVTTGLKGTEKLGEGRTFGSWTNLAGKVTFRQAYLLTSIYDCFAGPETGVMVFAGGYTTPKVLIESHIYGYHHSWPETRVVMPDCDCAPCYRVTDGLSCPKVEGEEWPVCTDIPPDTIVSEIAEVISEWRNGAVRVAAAGGV